MPDSPPAEHAISVETQLELTRKDADDLPYGFVILDESGTILLYNRYESAMSRLEPSAVLGKNWFRDVAPCTRVAAFQGTFTAFVASGEPSIDFSFWFHFMHGSQLVNVTFLRSPAPGEVFMTVERKVRLLPHEGERSPVARLDEEGGLLRTPLGLGVPLPVEVTDLALELVGLDGARRLGAEVGRRLSAAAAELASREHGRPLRELESLLAVGLLDRLLAGSGLGRLALDAEPEGPIVLLLLPPAPGDRLPGLYEGLLGQLASALAARPVAARLRVGDKASVTPWRFALSLAPPEDPASGDPGADFSPDLVASGSPPVRSAGALFDRLEGLRGRRGASVFRGEGP